MSGCELLCCGGPEGGAIVRGSIGRSSRTFEAADRRDSDDACALWQAGATRSKVRASPTDSNVASVGVVVSSQGRRRSSANESTRREEQCRARFRTFALDVMLVCGAV